MPHNQHHHMTGLGWVGNFSLTVIMAISSHFFTTAFLQGLAAFIAIVSGGLNIYFQVKKNRKIQ